MLRDVATKTSKLSIYTPFLLTPAVSFKALSGGETAKPHDPTFVCLESISACDGQMDGHASCKWYVHSCIRYAARVE